MTNDERAMYTGMAISRNTEVTLRWSRSQMFMLINSALFTLLFTKDAGFLLYFSLGLFGFILSVLWFWVNLKTQHWIDYWQGQLAKIKHTEEPDTVNAFIGPEWDKANQGIPFHWLLAVMPVVFGGLWIIVFFVSFTKP